MICKEGGEEDDDILGLWGDIYQKVLVTHHGDSPCTLHCVFWSCGPL